MIKKRNIFAFVLFLLLSAAFSTVGASSDEACIPNYKIQLFLNDEPIELTNKPFFYENSVYVPLREVSELADKPAQISWNNGKISIYIADGIDSYEINIGSNEIKVTSEVPNVYSSGTNLERNAPVLMNNQTYVPIGFINFIYNRAASQLDLSYVFGSINSNTPYLNNAESISFDDICYLQYSVDNGHFPWRLDPKETILSFLSYSNILSGGTISDFTEDSFNCSGICSKNGFSAYFELFKPLQTEQSIWVVKNVIYVPSGKPETVTIENVELYDENFSPINPDANWYTVGENVKATIYTTGARPQKITAYYTDSGTDMEQYKQVVGELIPTGDSDIVELTFDSDVHGHLWFVLDLGTHRVESERYCVMSENI